MKLIFTDFDGTLTLNEELGPSFFSILDKVQELDAELIVVSGRSISWGHFLLTHFPLRWAIMEGGGVILRKDPANDLIHSEYTVSQEELQRLTDSTEKLLAEVDGALLSPDSIGRVSDRALEFRYMTKTAVEASEKFFQKNQINYSQSNVHINFWCGEISKYNTVVKLLKNDFPQVKEESCLYFGDSLNDQSMFQFFPQTIGVSNIKKYLDQMEHKPRIILEGEENAGPQGVLNYLANFSF